MTSRILLLLAPPALAVLVIAACSTDNGDATHGPTIGDLPDSGRRKLPDGATVEADGARVDDDGGDADIDATGSADCPSGGTIAILAGDDTTLAGAVQTGGKAWSVAAITGGAAKDKPSVVPFGAGFLGVSHGAGDALQTFRYGTAWSAATTIGSAGVKGPPTLTVAGDKAHVVYSAGSESRFMHGINDGTSWNAATTAVALDSTHFSFGTISAGLAAVGTDVFFAENGKDNGLYARKFDTVWGASIPVTGAGTAGDVPATPELANVTGKYDLVLVYAYKAGDAVAYATHEPGSAAFGNPDTLYISGALTKDKFNLARLSGTSLFLTFRGTDGNAYSTQAAVADDVTWSPPLPIGGATLALDAAPAVAKGVCGADVVIAYATGGEVKVARLTGTTWSAPETIPGLTGTRVAIATK